VIEANHNFYRQYKPYIVLEWREEYFSYDHFKHTYKLIKSKLNSLPNISEVIQEYFQQCHDQICKIHNFIAWMVLQTIADLKTINDMLGKDGIANSRFTTDYTAILSDVVSRNKQFPISSVNDYVEDNEDISSSTSYSHSHRITSNDINRDPTTISDRRTKSVIVLPPSTDSLFVDRSIELSIRNVFNRIQDLDKFYRLNFYCIRKISKKMDKLLKLTKTSFLFRNQQDSPEASIKGSDSTSKASDNKSIRNWMDTPGGCYFNTDFVSNQHVIEELKKECVQLYTLKFRKTYPDLATFELEFVKEKDRIDHMTKILMGMKLGLFICMVSVCLSI
jgi:hypothetical protein